MAAIVSRTRSVIFCRRLAGMESSNSLNLRIGITILLVQLRGRADDEPVLANAVRLVPFLRSSEGVHKQRRTPVRSSQNARVHDRYLPFGFLLNIAGRFGPQPAQTAHTSGRCRSCLLLSREWQSGTDQIYRASLVVSLHSECAAHACSSALNWSPSSYAEILNLARALQAGTPNRRHHPVGPQIDRPTTGRIRL